MKPVHREKRKAYMNGPDVKVASVKRMDPNNTKYSLFIEGGDLGYLSDDDDAPAVKENKMTKEAIKIQALTQAVTMSKLMSDVSLDDVFVIASKIATYLDKSIGEDAE